MPMSDQLESDSPGEEEITTVQVGTSADTAAKQDEIYKPRFKRSRTGCLRCRKGKHKCDEEKPVCRRCRHSKGECIWPILLRVCGNEKSRNPDEETTDRQREDGQQPSKKRRRKEAARIYEQGQDQGHHTGPTTSKRQEGEGARKDVYFPLNEEQMVGQGSDFTFDYDSDIARVTRTVKTVATARQSKNGLEEEDVMDLVRAQGEHGTLARVPTEPLVLVFPNDHERELMHHLLCFGNILLYAVPRANQPIQYLNLAQCLTNRRGTSIETDAVLLSLLSVAAVHRSSIVMQQQHKYLKSPPVGRWGSPRPGHIALIDQPESDHMPTGLGGEFSQSQDSVRRHEGEGEYRRAIGNQFARLALELCKTGVLLKLASGSRSSSLTPTMSTDNHAVQRKEVNDDLEEISILLLSSTVSIIISQALNGGTLWQEAYATALTIIGARGGPLRMLESAQRRSNEEIMRVRTLLENLVIVDVCWCLASGSAPTLMTEAFAPWWFDFVESDEDTVHNSYGVDRGVIEMLNRVNILVHERKLLTTALDPTYLQQHLEKVHDLMLELSVWENDLQKDAGSGRPARVALGNTVLVHTIKIVIHVDLLDHPHSHSEVQASAEIAIGNLGRSSAGSAVVALLLPAIISGSMMFKEEGRDRIRKAIMELRSTTAFAFDVEEALGMLNKLYALRDQGQVDPPWREVMKAGLLLI
ncbi:hypothetical protein V866_008413 [Kwoniella sp. B9012]|uniref:Zn(2)-C6 fungal-type domain-containing protein n=1 Tax=Kwoniella europaea PYCC6329 TaxID=1423913 RepID=A0AAX4KV22_9TREE